MYRKNPKSNVEVRKVEGNGLVDQASRWSGQRVSKKNWELVVQKLKGIKHLGIHLEIAILCLDYSFHNFW